MIIPEVIANVAAPLLLSTISVPLILKADTIREQQSLHPLDAGDPASWNRSKEWLMGAPLERIHMLPSEDVVVPGGAPCFVAEHSNGQWRTLRRHGSVQSVTFMCEDKHGSLVPFHSSAGNECNKVMASAYAAFCCGRQQLGNAQSILHLGLGGGTLPMLLGESCTAIEIDADAASLAIKYCGVNPDLVSIVHGNALDHQRLAPGPHSCIFVDVFGQDNNVPETFAEEEFIEGLWESLDGEGTVIANFHCNDSFNKNQEDVRLQQATLAYSRVFSKSRRSELIRIPSRYQGNMILCARRVGKNCSGSSLSPEGLDIERARQVANLKGWRFDPGARLKYAEAVPAHHEQQMLLPLI